MEKNGAKSNAEGGKMVSFLREQSLPHNTEDLRFFYSVFNIFFTRFYTGLKKVLGFKLVGFHKIRRK